MTTGPEFVALAPSEVSGQIGARWRQFTDLLESALSIAQEQGILDRQGAPEGGHAYSGRYIRMGPWLAWVGLGANTWADTADTPLWLNFTGYARPAVDVALEAFRPLDPDRSTRVFLRQEHVVVALYLKCGSGRDEVVSDLVAQLEQVRSAIDAYTQNQSQ